MNVVLSVMILGCLGGRGLAQTVSSELPIPVPTGATVNFEVDARDDDLLAFVKQLIAPPGPTPSRKSLSATIPLTGETAKTYGQVSAIYNYVVQSRLDEFLRPVHRVHVVAFTPADPKLKVVDFYESLLAKEGGKRTLYVAGDAPIFVMRFDNPSGMALVAQSADKDVVVVRTNGLPDMAVLGRIGHELLGAMFPTQTFGTPALPAANAKKPLKSPKVKPHK